MAIVRVLVSAFPQGTFDRDRLARELADAGLPGLVLERVDAAHAGPGYDEDVLIYDDAQLSPAQKTTFDNVIAAHQPDPLGDDFLKGVDAEGISYTAGQWETIATFPVPENCTIAVKLNQAVRGSFGGDERGGEIEVVSASAYRVGAGSAVRGSYDIDISRSLGRRRPRARASASGNDLLIQVRYQEAGTNVRTRTYHNVRNCL